MNVLIVEDEDYQARMLKKLLERREVHVEEVLNSVKSTIDYLSSHTPDLIFMDVELKDGICFDIFNELQFDVPVIFVTNHTSFSMEAFYSNGIHYLVKPITEARLDEGLNKYYSLKQSLHSSSKEGLPTNATPEPENSKDQKILIRIGKNKQPLRQEELALFIIVGGFVYLITKDQKKHLIDHNMEDLFNLLDSSKFFRLNRQCITHINTIHSFSSYTRGRLKVKLKPYWEDSVVVSFRTRKVFLDWMEVNM